MNRFMLTLTLFCLAVAPAAAKGNQWKGTGWYVLLFGFTEDQVDEEPGWLEISAGPYSNEKTCEVDAKRQDTAEADYMLMFTCRHLERAPIPDGDGGILIWVPGTTAAP